MLRPDRLDCVLLMLLTAISRFLTRSRALYDLDSVNFALALDRFDPVAHQPHPPGYFLYVMAGRIARALTGDANDAFVAISVISSCIAVGFIYALAFEWFGRRAAVVAGVLFLISPLAWFHGTVALTYIVEMAFSASIGYLSWKAREGSTRHALCAGAVLGIAAGFRQSSALFLAPVLFFSIYRLGGSVIRRVLIVTGLVVAAWLLPMLHQAGGASHYVAGLLDLWVIAPGRVQENVPGIMMVIARCLTILLILLLALGPGAVLSSFAPRLHPSQPQLRRFILIWIAPATCFFSLVFLRFVNSGYLLLITPPIFALLGNRAAAWLFSSSRTPLKAAVAIATLASSCGIYIFAPFYCSFSSMRAFERQLKLTCERVRAQAKPSETVIIGFDSHFLGYRHAAYYLPEFSVLQYPEVKAKSGAKAFFVKDGRTELLGQFDPSEFKTATLFPLPDEFQYRAHVAIVRRLLAPVASIGRCVGGELCSFNAQDLSRLYSVSLDAGSVNRRLHLSRPAATTGYTISTK